jgi:histone H3/H4
MPSGYKEEFNMSEVLVVTSKVKEAIKAQGCNTAGDAVEAISAKVNAMVKDAAERAKANGRKTVRGVDF